MAAADQRISILLVSPISSAEAGMCLERISRLNAPPLEVLLPAGVADGTSSRSYAFTVRSVPTTAVNPFDCLNELAATAEGDHLLAVRSAQCLASAPLDELHPVTGHWTLVVPEGESHQRTTVILTEAATVGMALLSPLGLLESETMILVPRELHSQVGGYKAKSANPLLDYCLRLLWQAEPVLFRHLAQDETASDGKWGVGTCGQVVGSFLESTYDAPSSPNPFAPARCNWGLHFVSHVINQGLLPSARLMVRINDEIADHLYRRYVMPISVRPGVNLVGPARGEFGLAENMRAFARASLEGGIPCAIRDINLALSTRQGDHSLVEHFAEEARHNCSIFFLNPDSKQLYDQSLDAVVFQRPTLDFRHLKIGYWFWELEKIPPQWDSAIRKVDEIWVATEFVAEALRRVTEKPVVKITTPIEFRVLGDYRRKHFDLPEGVFLFLFGFDFHSFAERKNPYGLIRAFQKAFPRHRQEVALVIKSINGMKKPGVIDEMMAVAGEDPRILIRDGFLSRDEVFGLQSVVDAYVSLHRAEGLGLGMAECMFQGKPVIGTGYSGNLEFMNDQNSGLVRYSMVSIGKGEYLYDDPGFFWAEPDEDHAAHLMRRMVDDSGYRQVLAERGRRDIHERFNNQTTASQMRARLNEIGIL